MSQVKPLKLLSNGEMSFIDSVQDELTMRSLTSKVGDASVIIDASEDNFIELKDEAGVTKATLDKDGNMVVQDLTVEGVETVVGAIVAESSLTVEGDLSVDGSVTLGDSGSDLINFVGMAGTSLDMASNKIINLADPTDNSDAATKLYVDGEITTAISGVSFEGWELGGNLLDEATNFGSTNDEDVRFVRNDQLAFSLIDSSSNPGNAVIRVFSPLTTSSDINFFEAGEGVVAGIRTDEGTLEFVSDGVTSFTISSSGNFSNTLDMGDNLITSLATPSASGDAANKDYVDTEISEAISNIDLDSVWSLEGNSLSVSGRLGTTNDQDFAIIRNNQEYLKLSNTTFYSMVTPTLDSNVPVLFGSDESKKGVVFASEDGLNYAVNYGAIGLGSSDELNFGLVDHENSNGSVTIFEGSRVIANNGGTYTAGEVILSAGATDGDVSNGSSVHSGSLSIETDNGAGVNANSGNISLTTGSPVGSGVRGVVNIDAGLVNIDAAGLLLGDTSFAGTNYVLTSYQDVVGDNYAIFESVGEAGLLIRTDNKSASEEESHDIYIRSGNASGASGKSGNVIITTGGVDEVTGTKGFVVAKDLIDAVDPRDAVSLQFLESYVDGAASGFATQSYVDQELDNYLPLLGGSMLGALDMGDNLITSLATPSASGDAANKGYVDQAILDALENVDAATAEDVALTFTASGAIAAGAPVYVVSSADDTVAEGDASEIGTSRLIGIAEEAIADTEQGLITVTGFAEIPVGQIDGGAFTVGSPVYLSETTGNLTSTAPTTTGARVYQVGTATASNKLVIDLKQGITIT